MFTIRSKYYSPQSLSPAPNFTPGLLGERSAGEYCYEKLTSHQAPFKQE